MRSFGPAVVADRDNKQISRIHCHFCMFKRSTSTEHFCGYLDRINARKIDDPEHTPDWCEMKAGHVRDATDMMNGVTYYVIRWSGRKTDEPREIYAGIPSEASRQFRLASRDAKRGTVRLEDSFGKTLEMWPEAKA